MADSLFHRILIVSTGKFRMETFDWKVDYSACFIKLLERIRAGKNIQFSLKYLISKKDRVYTVCR